jgi:hypothetical protein
MLTTDTVRNKALQSLQLLDLLLLSVISKTTSVQAFGNAFDQSKSTFLPSL